jgi:hypothetical protein
MEQADLCRVKWLGPCPYGKSKPTALCLQMYTLQQASFFPSLPYTIDPWRRLPLRLTVTAYVESDEEVSFPNYYLALVSKIIVKSQGTMTRERLPWQGPAA